MKKIALIFSIVCGCLFSCYSFALECKDLYGYWRGDLEPLRNVVLFIQPYDGAQDAEISFIDEHGQKNDIDQLIGQCHQYSNGSVSMDLSRNSSQTSVKMRVDLNDSSKVSALLAYKTQTSYGSGQGELSK